MEQARRFVRENKDRPFFLYVPTTVPHLALQVPEDSLAEYRGKWPDLPYTGNRGYLPNFTPRATYAAMITRMDREVGRLVQLVKDLGLEERTIFVFTSDNGPIYEQLGGTDAEFFHSAGSLRGFKGSVYEGGIREPLVVCWKGHIAAGTASDRVTGFEDWLPTLLDLVGDAAATPNDTDGVSFAPVLRGQTIPERPFLYREFPAYGGQQLLRLGDWVGVRQHLVPPGKRTKPVIKTELYNLKDDIGQQHDVAAEHLDIVAKIERLMRQQHTASKVFPISVLDKG
jgi:arylsulfatase A-like enzyme